MDQHLHPAGGLGQPPGAVLLSRVPRQQPGERRAVPGGPEPGARQRRGGGDRTPCPTAGNDAHHSSWDRLLLRPPPPHRPSVSTLLQAILKRSLKSTCSILPLMKRGHPSNLEFFLSHVGKIYMNGSAFLADLPACLF